MFETEIADHVKCIEGLHRISEAVAHAAELLTEAILAGNKLLLCGNGGSAADAQHFAAEIVGRFQKERPAYPAMALTTDASVMTALSNDYAYDVVFARQTAAFGRPGDVLLGISTSGQSENVLKAMGTARELGMKRIGLLGGTGGPIAEAVDVAVVVPCRLTARIQEAHGFILHHWAGAIEAAI
jgi:D-sedoheptulose 7-phosphate isomerase